MGKSGEMNAGGSGGSGVVPEPEPGKRATGPGSAAAMDIMAKAARLKRGHRGS